MFSMSDQTRQRRSYTQEYRVEAAGLVIDTGRSIAAVAREIGVGEQTLGTWVKAEKGRRRVDGESTGALNEDERAELARLRRENFDLKQDNEFLGKAAAFFASKPRNKRNSNRLTRRRHATRSAGWPDSLM